MSNLKNKITNDEFIELLKELDNKLEQKRNQKTLIIKAIDGFAMMHHATQKEIVTRNSSLNIDTLTLDYEMDIQESILDIASEHGISHDWINNQWYRLMSYHDNLEGLVSWERVEINTFKHIELYIADLEGIFAFKLRAIQIELISDREPRQNDILDVISIMTFYGEKDFENISLPKMASILDQYREAVKYMGQNYNRFLGI